MERKIYRRVEHEAISAASESPKNGEKLGGGLISLISNKVLVLL